MKTLIVISLVVFAGILAEAKVCESPSVKTVQYITQDATVLTRVAFLVQFQITCKNDAQYKPTLYAEVEGKSMPAIKLNNWDRKNNLFENYQVLFYQDLLFYNTSVTRYSFFSFLNHVISTETNNCNHFVVCKM